MTCVLIVNTFCGQGDYGYVPFVVDTISFMSSFMAFTGFLTWVARRMILLEKELLTLPENMNLPTDCSWFYFVLF